MNTQIKTDAVDDQGDIVYLTIDQWKATYGEPGSGLDAHGRSNGTFHTEPCFCEKPRITRESQARLLAECNELATRIHTLTERGASDAHLDPFRVELAAIRRIYQENATELEQHTLKVAA
jgi:hypothetical protein